MAFVRGFFFLITFAFLGLFLALVSEFLYNDVGWGETLMLQVSVEIIMVTIFLCCLIIGLFFLIAEGIEGFRR